MMDRVPNDKLREAYLKSGLTPTEVALAAGYFKKGRGDSTRLQRVLGLRPYATKGKSTQQTITYDEAVRLTEALGLDPIDTGV